MASHNPHGLLVTFSRFQSLSVDFSHLQSFSISFSHFQSLSATFNHVDPVNNAGFDWQLEGDGKQHLEAAYSLFTCALLWLALDQPLTAISLKSVAIQIAFVSLCFCRVWPSVGWRWCPHHPFSWHAPSTCITVLFEKHWGPLSLEHSLEASIPGLGVWNQDADSTPDPNVWWFPSHPGWAKWILTKEIWFPLVTSLAWAVCSGPKYNTQPKENLRSWYSCKHQGSAGRMPGPWSLGKKNKILARHAWPESADIHDARP